MAFSDSDGFSRFFSAAQAGESVARCRTVKVRGNDQCGILGKIGKLCEPGGPREGTTRTTGRESMIMKNAWIFVAVASLFLAAGRCPSQDTGTLPEPVFFDLPAGALEGTQPAPGTKCLTLHQRLQEWGKVRPVSQTITSPMDPVPDTMPPTPLAPVAAPIAPVAAPCLTGPPHRCFRDQLVDWLTYRPLCHNICDCFPRCTPCCEPRLYTFFIAPCCINPTGAGCRAACAHDRCCGCGERQPCCKCRSRAGCFHLWHGWDDVLFNHPKNCAQGTCMADDSVADMSTK
jgi:hypothetical protein